MTVSGIVGCVSERKKMRGMSNLWFWYKRDLLHVIYVCGGIIVTQWAAICLLVVMMYRGKC